MAKPRRISQQGKRHRRDDGPAVLEVEPVPPPQPAELGQSHLYTYQIIQGGPRAAIAAEHEAARLSAKFGEEIEAKWCLATPFLLKLAAGEVAVSSGKSVSAQRERARYALQWRPRFLAIVSLTHSVQMAARAAKVSRDTVRHHRAADPDFDAQVMLAQDQAIELLKDVAMRRAIEGDCKPIYWQGIVVGHEREYSDKLQIEMLRAFRPDVFKTPGSKVNINTGNQILGSGTIIDTPVMLKLQEMRQESLRKLAEKKAQARDLASNEARFDGTPALPSVPPAA